MKPIIYLLLLILIIAGCNPSKKLQAATSNATLTETYWKLTELLGKAIKTTADNVREAHIILQQKNNMVKGHGGCNSFGGTFELKEGNRINFSKLISTEMICPDMENETVFFKMLGAVDNYTINGNTLQLYKAKMVTAAKFEAVYFK